MSLLYICVCVCVDILTFNKEKIIIIIFQFIHNRILSKTHKKCRYIMSFNIYIYILNTEQFFFSIYT